MAITRKPGRTIETPTKPRGRPRKGANVEQTAEPDEDVQTRLDAADEISHLASQQLAQEALVATSEPLAIELPISAEDATEELPIVYGTADGILNVLQLEKTPQELERAIADSKSRLNRKFNSNATILQQERQPFTNHEGNFIDPVIIEQYLGGPAGLVEAIVQKINLAIFALELRDWYKLSKKIPEEQLKNLDESFPTPFVHSFVKDGRVGSSRLFTATFRLALELRTQVAILAATNPGVEYDDIRSFFIEDMPEQDSETTVTLMECGGRVNVAEMPDQSANVQERIQVLEGSIGTDMKKSAKKLKDTFGWQKNVIGAFLWIQLRAEELTTQLSRHGFNGGHNDLPILFGGGIPGAGQVRPNAPVISHAPNAHPGAQNQFNGPFPGTIQPPRSFMDSQPNARTFEFDHQTYHQSDLLPNSSIISSDQGMGGLNLVQQYNRTANEPSQKRKRDDLEFQPGESQESTYTAPTPARKKGRPPASSVTQRSDEEVEEAKRRALATGNAYLQMQTENKRNGRHKPHTNEIKSRKRWTIEETGTLINLITEFGVSWAQIKKFDEANGNYLLDRDQVNLKDKARNIKFDLLKSRQALPRNFDLVTLSATMKNKLNAMDGDGTQPEDSQTLPANDDPSGSIDASNIAPELRNPYRAPSPDADDEEAAFENASQNLPVGTQ